jgi:Protein of unknown function (DUF559)
MCSELGRLPLPVLSRGEGWGEGESWGERAIPAKDRVDIMRGPDRRTVPLERRLRRQAIDTETKLWFALRDRRLCGFKFVRQEAIGPYIVRFRLQRKEAYH